LTHPFAILGGYFLYGHHFALVFYKGKRVG
jgi:hypothetical protein